MPDSSYSADTRSLSLTPTLPPNRLNSTPGAGRMHPRTGLGGAQEQTRGVRQDQAAILEVRAVELEEAELEAVEEGQVEHQGGRWVLMM